ncbi:fad binding domain-containing protein [Colletotrichum incanum]|uniref:Fad binding domain-containing protein n=1 Tax=Colletotrichum incanum TaxID=1573173 RepID=A0A166MUU0_COLIC|nr:fad binding domain-containing protein [Colletotrichum incanum]
MARPGSNNIQNDITIDLGLMAKTTYSPRKELAMLLPGGTWTDVYHEVEKHNAESDLDGRRVAGGRESTFAIDGLLTGGGKMSYTCRSVNYEVVLADGSILQANDTENEDLFRVLKGGGNNFCIVTRFDMVYVLIERHMGREIVYAKESTLYSATP